jgi:hypothetical protein
MAAAQLSEHLCQQAVNALAANGGDKTRAANSLGISRSTYKERLSIAALRGFSANGPIKSGTDIVRERSQLDSLRRQLHDAQKELIAAQDLRTGILGLGEPIISKINPPSTKRGKRNGRSAILHVSDIQYGEFIDPAEIDGVNAYSVDIANARIDRLFHYVARLLEADRHGDPVERIHLCLGGDMVSGSLHEELAKTDELPELPSARQVAARLAGNIKELRRRIEAPINIYSVPGNHGRLTHKPESKGHVLNNLDTLVAWFVEAALADDKGISVRYGESVDLLFDVYGFPFLLTHGDRMGGRGGGGTGFIGPIGAISKGHQKLYMDYAARGVTLYKILTAHYHTAVETVHGYGNSALAGWSQFARDFRMTPEPATQNLLIIHQEHGEIARHRVLCGVPAEGKSQDPTFRWSNNFSK